MSSENGCKASELFQAQAHLYNHILSFLKPMSIKWVVELGIPDIIHNHGQPITLSQLLSALRIPEAKAARVHSLMRLLAHNKFFTIVEMEGKEAYALAPSSELLVKGTDHCLSSMVQLITNPNLVDLYNHLGKWTCGDELTIFETATGPGDYWGFIYQNPAHLKSFNEAMESDSHVMRLALSDCKSVFEGLSSLVDVGGGTGNTAKIICERFPMLKCTVLDLPQIVAGLSGNENLSFVAGNMFESIPQADAVLLKWILHDWNDDDCVKILKKCKEAVLRKGKGRKVIIIDIVINEKQDKHEMTEVKLFFNIVMMASFNGRERDEKNWKQIFTKAGFTHYKIYPIFGFRSLIELYA
ncbi:hypothetical protein TSUD_64000 [Trifolium subterraneum]|uniref:isoflavone 7-O-methyltransferase n=1 Tax=Trifolium subterraneum TaxID=3900 RepID=A0A2Z6ML84_TRISU|nr:hypothetical protein TSUD_64000 [Trifolium subterraneum]